MNKFALALAALAGVLLGAAGAWFLAQDEGGEQAGAGRGEPLYWVAPMDPNYRRDGPGKSPMGMDLVPVYEEPAAGGAEAGVVSISPVVENNLGVRIAPVRLDALQTRVGTVGYVRFNEDDLVAVSPRIEGWVERLDVKAEGESVARGQQLYALYSPALVNAQEEMLLALQRDNPVLIAAAEERLSALEVPAEEIARLREERQVARTIPAYAPRGGVVAELNVREGAYVQPGMPVLTIGSLDEVWVIAEVFERQAPLVGIGDPVTMTLDYLPGREWRGEVDFIYPTLDEDTRTLRVRLRFDNRDGSLKPNMFAQVEIRGAGTRETLLVPAEAVIRTGRQDRVVLALGGGRFKSVEVELGWRGENGVEILAGLREGDAVVVSAQFLLDSESSIDSDFQRMNPEGLSGMDMEEGGAAMAGMDMDGGAAPAGDSVTAPGTED